MWPASDSSAGECDSRPAAASTSKMSAVRPKGETEPAAYELTLFLIMGGHSVDFAAPATFAGGLESFSGLAHEPVE